MRELLVSEYTIVSGGVTESQCVGAATLAGAALGALITRSPNGTAAGATAGGILGGLICAPLTGEDGDG